VGADAPQDRPRRGDVESRGRRPSRRRLSSPTGPAGPPVDGVGHRSGRATAHKISWISDTWGGTAGLAASGMAWAALDAGTPVAVAVPFFVGELSEDIGVVTQPEHRRQGLARSCAAAVVTDIRRRRHTPTWTTSPDNIGSLTVAERLGFMPERNGVLWAVRTPILTD